MKLQSVVSRPVKAVWIFGNLILMLCLLIGIPRADAIFYNIDPAQSSVTMTIFGFDFAGAADGTFYFATDPGIEAGAWDILWDLDATVEDIDAGLAALRNITIQTDPTKDAFGEITDPNPTDGVVSLNQFLPMIVHFTYDPLFGASEDYEIISESCFGEVILCENPASSGEATIHTATLRFNAAAQDTVPAEENPLGEDMPVRIILKADGTTNGLSGVAAGGRMGVSPQVRIWPNPSAGPVTVSLGAFQGTPPEIGVFDVSGRRIQLLSSTGGLSHEYQWNGRDSAGHPAPAGIYFIRCRIGDDISYNRCLRLK
ncbi:MAG: hypothetical protein KJ970_06440 [Candidatus Eisenbacteria bacterium]|uniref:T9SS type A sorting domain-containing protein n=1 Tax=Eiseniibacteriota bacterium TaxID=2212470 RepID=A0A948W5Z2_UNCEI|nr:hypothetical protein [Candidatus Eisenbacteria bacterium]MBU1951090.1 hypothetical protein [Candidatus Eisenbacteria bacterium]MBU2690550.1 hypothetical protein [Candidatus Eisenbacteria bacterium]